MDLRILRLASLAVLILCWIAFASLFAFRRRPRTEKTTRRDRASVLGIVLQALGFAAIWGLRRPWLTPLIPWTGTGAVLLPMVTALLALVSYRLARASVRSLGKQWSYQARLVDGHRLVTAGPYRWMRHPIYASTLGYLIATGLDLSRLAGLATGLLLSMLGTLIRTRSEERLLRSHFGPQYEEYARRVPPILPRIFARAGDAPRG